MKSCLAFFTFSFFGLLATSAHAEDGTSLAGLLEQEVVTSATKSAEETSATPALSRSISAEEIRRYGMTSVDEALDFLGVGAKTQRALGVSELSVRGIGFTGDRGNHVLLLIDGHVVNEPLYGQASFDQALGVPLELIDHIELILGPGSAVHGSNAVLAVVNVVTKSASASEGTHVAVEGSLAGTARATLTAGHSFDLLGRRAGVTTGLSYYRRDSTVEVGKQDLGIDPFSGQPSRFSATGAPTGVWGGTVRNAYHADIPALHVRFVRDRLEVAGRAVVASLGDPSGLGDFDDARSGTLQRRASLSIQQGIALGKVGETTLRVYGDAFGSHYRVAISRAQVCPVPGTITCEYHEDGASRRVGVAMHTALDWWHDGRLTTSVGTNASVDHVAARVEAFDRDTGVPLTNFAPPVDITSIVNLAAHADQGFEPVTWLRLDAGGRVDWRKITDHDGQALPFTPQLTPRVAAVVRPWGGGSLKAIYAQAFRAPSPYEADAHSPSLIHTVALPPEHTESTELVFEQRLDTHRLMVGAFRTVYHGTIERVLLGPAETKAAIDAGLTPMSSDPRTPLYQYRSDDHLETHGFNLAVDGTVQRRFRYAASVTATVARAQGSERLPMAPQLFGNARMSYDLGGALPTAALATSFAGNALSDRGYDSGFAQIVFAPPSLELRATLTGAVPHVAGLSYRIILAQTVHDRTPFAIGPAVRAQPGITTPTLAPADRSNATVGLQYDF